MQKKVHLKRLANLCVALVALLLLVGTEWLNMFPVPFLLLLIPLAVAGLLLNASFLLENRRYDSFKE